MASAFQVSPDFEVVSWWHQYLDDPEVRRELDEARLSGTRLSIDWRLAELREPRLIEHLQNKPSWTLRTLEAELKDPADPDAPTPRLTLRNIPESEWILPHDVSAAHLGRLVAIRCQVKVSRSSRPTIFEAAWECKFCANVEHVLQEDEALQPPVQCAACEKTGPWRLRDDQSRHVDVQHITVEDPPEALRGRQASYDLHVIMQGDDYRDRLWPGDRVVLYGVAVTRARHLRGRQGVSVERECVVSIIGWQADTEGQQDLEATDDEKEAFHALAARPDHLDQLIDSFRPGTIGYRNERLGLLLCLVGAPDFRDHAGETQNGAIHVLWVGDPATSKTKCLDFFCDVSPRVVRATGGQSTKAAIIGGAVSDEAEGRYHVHAGAVVRAHLGHFVPDEIGRWPKEVVNSLLEPMASGRAILGRVGNVEMRMPARCAIAAAMNPRKGERFSGVDEPGSEIGLDPAIQSRWHLCFCTPDEVDEERDRAIARSITGRGTKVEPPVSKELLRRYAYYAWSIDPLVSDEASQVIEDEFVSQRRAARAHGYGIDPRYAHRLTALTLAFARLRLSHEATAMDARRAVEILQASLQSQGAVKEGGAIDWSLAQFGSGKSQHDRVRVVEGIVRRLCAANPAGWALEDDVVEEAHHEALEPEDVRGDLRRLLRSNTLYCKGGGGTYAPLR